jgi:serine/threonine-protein kinase RsbW
MGFAKRSRDGGGNDPAASRAKAKSTSGGANGNLKYEIASNFDDGCEVQRQILKEIERHGFNTNSLFATRLALEEAMVNAIKHGNKLDPKKKVLVEARVSAKRVEIEIEDQGPGFDRSSVPDPTADENLCKCSGRGILLIEAYMNSVTWSHGGRRVKMVRYNEPHELPERT